MASGQLVINEKEGGAQTIIGDQNKKRPDDHKPHFCLYCKKDVKKINMHFSRKHRDEIRVKRIMSMGDINKRRWAWKKLVQEGDNMYNSMNLENTKSTLKTVRKCTTMTHKKRYFTCPKCLGRIRTSYKCQHSKICSVFLKNEEGEKEQTQELDLFHASIIEGLPENFIRKFRKNKMVYGFIKGIWEEKGSSHRKTIREKMKICFVLEEELQRETKKTKKLKFFFKPKFVDSFVKAIKSLSGIKIIENQVFLKVPTKAQRLCRITEQFGEFLKVQYIKMNKNARSEEVNRFLLVFVSEAEKKIRNLADKTLRTKKFEAPVELPKATQITALINHLKEETKQLIEKMDSCKNEKTWRNLAENILLRLTIFNRRRGGAVEKMKLEDFQKTGNATENLTEEFVFNLSKEEKSFLEKIKIIEIRHKCGNIISIFIDEQLRGAIEKLIESRETGRIHEKNTFVFAAGKGSLNPIRCVDVLAKYRKIFPPELQKQLTATNLRKQGATAAQVLDLSPEDLEEWASHMGHSAQVHKRYYRYKEKPNQILKTGRILNALDQGTLKYFKGKNVTDIPFESDEHDQTVVAQSQPTQISSIFPTPGTSQETYSSPETKSKKGAQKNQKKYAQRRKKKTFSSF